MNIRLYNARILTMEHKRPAFSGEIWIKDDRIVYVGEEETLKEELEKGEMEGLHFDEEIDCDNNLLMPGFKDCHTHSAMTFLRSYADDEPLQKWLAKKVFPNEQKLNEDYIYEFTRLAVLEYLSAGITTIFDMYLMPDVTARACMDTGMRAVLTSGLNNFTSSVYQMEDEYKRWNSKEYPLISYHLGFHAEYTNSKENLYNLGHLVRNLRAPVFTHLAETEGEVDDCKKRYGMTPAMFIESMGLFAYGGGGFHCVHMSQDDMDVFKRNRLFVITNPASNMKLASGIAPIAEFVKNKIPVAIGTDGAASNNSLDMFKEMFLVSALSKIREKEADSMDAVRVLRMATVNGARALGLKRADVLAKGKYADIIMIDMKRPNMQPENNIRKNLVYAGDKSNIKMTMIAGRVLYKDGEFHIGEEPEKIYRSCNDIVKKILK
ncbi:MAG: amidohydrolase [Lachnospiraceae bacterium]|nr:amidohydrolase [Lachnospiraceae bacterium]